MVKNGLEILYFCLRFSRAELRYIYDRSKTECRVSWFPASPLMYPAAGWLNGESPRSSRERRVIKYKMTCAVRHRGWWHLRLEREHASDPLRSQSPAGRAASQTKWLYVRRRRRRRQTPATAESNERRARRARSNTVPMTTDWACISVRRRR